MSNMGFVAGGMAQGFGQAFNNARQKAIENSYVKIQQQHQQMIQQQMNQRSAEQMMAHPETAEAAGHIYPEIDKYYGNPEGYSWQRPMTPGTSTPVQGPPTPDQAAAGQFTLPPVETPPQEYAPASGSQGFSDMLSYYGKQAREAQIDAESRKQARALELLRAQLAAIPTKAYLSTMARNDANLASEEDRAEARARGTDRGHLPLASPLAEEKARGTGIGQGKIVVPGNQGSISVPVGGGGGAQLRLNPKEQQELTTVRDALDTFKSIKSGLDAGKLPDPGYASAKLNSALETIGGMVPGVTLDDPQKTGFYKFLKGTALERLKAAGGVRAAGSPTELRATQSFFAQPENSPGGLKARINNTVALLQKQYDTLLEMHKASGKYVDPYTSMQPNLLTPEQIMGVGGDTQPVPQQPQGSVQMPGQAPYNLGVHPVPPPTGLKTLRY